MASGFLTGQADSVSLGGDVNTTDDDGDTPLYTVENVETARYLVEHGATVDRRNNEGIQVRPASPTRRDPLPPVYIRGCRAAETRQAS